MIRKEFILNELKYRYPIVSGAIRHPELPVGRPLFLDGEAKSLGSHVFVCRAEELADIRFAAQREPLLLCIGEPERRILDALDVCMLPEGEQPAAVLNFVQRLFDRLDEWTQRLKDTAESETEIEELFRTAGEMLQNPVLLIDSMNHVVAQSEQFDMNKDLKQWIDRFMPERTKEDGVFGGAQNDRLTRILSVGETKYTLVCLASERPLYGSDEVVFETLAGYARLMLSEQKLYPSGVRRNRRGEEAEHAFRSLLIQETPDRSTIGMLSGLGWNETESYCVLAAEPVGGDLRTARAAYLCDRIESRFEGCCAFAETPVIIAILNSSYMEEAALREALLSLSADVGLRFGICESYRGFSYLAQRLELSKFALTHSDQSVGAAFFHEIADDYVSDRVASDVTANLVALRSVLALAESDHAHGTSYIETAERYIKNRFNAVKTASDLFIHRSTFLYRLERMKTQFGLDLESGDVSLLHLLLSIRMIRENRPETRQ